MSVHLHVQRVALWLRLFLVCLVLTGVSAPTPRMGYREAVVAIATATAQAPEERAAPAPPIDAPERARPAVGPWLAPIAAGVADERCPAPPRRLFLIHSALLC